MSFAESRRTEAPQLVAAPEALVVGRYELRAQLAKGGIATVYLGRLRGAGGLHRVVAIKRLHTHLRADDDASTMFLDEARVALRVKHPNVVHAVDVVLRDDEIFIVMEYIEGTSLSQLLRCVSKANEQIPVRIGASIVAHTLHGLHAAHEARNERGESLGIIHRDVSPQNLLVGTDGVARVLDFGVAKTVSQMHVTRHGEVKGKIAYMAPEQLLGAPLTRAVDVFAVGIILWEVLTGHRLFYGDNDGEVVRRLLQVPIPPPSTLNAALSSDVDQLVLRALERDPAARFSTAEEMAVALERVLPPLPTREVGAWVGATDREGLRDRSRLVERVETSPTFEPETETVAGASPSRRGAPRSSRRAALLALALALGLALTAIAGVGLVAQRGRMRSRVASPADPPGTSDSTPAPVVVAEEPSPGTVIAPVASASVRATLSAPSRRPSGGGAAMTPKFRAPARAPVTATASAPLYTRD
jgi:eukaryotic-like serine/threonine-protein kinase